MPKPKNNAAAPRPDSPAPSTNRYLFPVTAAVLVLLDEQGNVLAKLPTLVGGE